MTTRSRSLCSRRVLRVLARLALLVAIAMPGCIIIPTPESVLLEGRGVIEEADGAFLAAGEVRREDVLLRFGEPDLVVDEDRVLAYHWARAQGWLFVGAYPGGAVMPIPKHRYLVLEFDPAGLLQRYEFLDKLPDSLRGEAGKRPFVAPAERQVIVVNPLPAWPDEAGRIRAGAAPRRLAMGEFLPKEADAAAPDFLGQLKSFGIIAADVRASRPVMEIVRTAVAAQLAQSGLELAAVEEAEILVSGEAVHFGITTPVRLSLSLDVLASLDVTLRFSCAGSSRELLLRRFTASERGGPIDTVPFTAAEFQYVTTACLEDLQRQLGEDAELAALLAAAPSLCGD
jgi:hypothetical protein